MGFSHQEALAMTTAEADGYIEAYGELMIDGGGKKKFKVNKGKRAKG
jgi:hypothetical protein